jgi:MFS family permease
MSISTSSLTRPSAVGGKGRRRAQLSLFASIVGMISSLVAIFIGSFPIFLEPVSKTMGWGQATFPMMLMAVALSGAVLGPPMGRLIDRVGARPAALVGAGLWGIGLICLSRIGSGVPLRILIIALLGLGGGLSGQMTYAHVVTRWFDQHRGLALGLTLGVAPALSQAAIGPLALMMIDHNGWRFAYLMMGAFVLCITTPILFFFLSDAPNSETTTQSAKEGLAGVSIAAALRSFRFWVVTAALAIGTLVFNAIFQHSFGILTGYGLSRDAATAFVSVVAVAALPSPLIAGVLLDRLHSPRWAVAPFLACPLAGAVVISNLTNVWGSMIAAVLFGLALGAGPAIQPFILSRYFGPRSQAEIFGTSLIVIIAATAGGPVLMGLCFDHTGSYGLGLIGAQVIALLSLGLALALPQYRFSSAIARTA